MKQITTLTNNARQTFNAVLDDGSIVIINLVYTPANSCWNYSFQYGSFISSNRKLVVSPNLLRAFRNILPFGLALVTSDGYEAIYQNDFVNLRASLYTLNSADIVKAEELITLTMPTVSGNFIK